MSELYQSLEGEIIRIIIKHLKGGSDDITRWQAQKLADLRLFNSEVTKLLAEVTNVAESEIRRMFEETGIALVEDIDRAMPFDKLSPPNNLDKVMRGYFEQSWSEIDNYVNQTLITTNYGQGTATKAFTDVLNRTSAAFNTGLYTLEQSLERSIIQLAEKGISSGMIDRGGNVWNLENYVRTVLKSTLGNTYNEVRTSRMADYGVHTVIVTSHAGSREACSRVQGNVIDLRRPDEIPADSKYKSVYDPVWQARYGEASGLRGINCRHLFIPFIPGVSTNNQPKFDQELNEKVAKARDKQRAIERSIVKYKKRLMVAQELGSDNASHWKMMIGRRQKVMREHLKANGEYLSRNYKRERVYTPLETLLKDFDYKD